VAWFAAVIIAVVVAAAAGFVYYQFFLVQEADLPPKLVGTKQETTAAKIAVVRIVEGASLESNPEFMVPQVATVVIGINITIQWINEDTVPHTVVSDNSYRNAYGEAFDSHLQPEVGAFIMPGKSFEFTFTEPGTFTYHHEPHPWVQGTVIVMPAAN
jgi:plastocyanin